MTANMKRIIDKTCVHFGNNGYPHVNYRTLQLLIILYFFLIEIWSYTIQCIYPSDVSGTCINMEKPKKIKETLCHTHVRLFSLLLQYFTLISYLLRGPTCSLPISTLCRLFGTFSFKLINIKLTFVIKVICDTSIF